MFIICFGTFLKILLWKPVKLCLEKILTCMDSNLHYDLKSSSVSVYISAYDLKVLHSFLILFKISYSHSFASSQSLFIQNPTIEVLLVGGNCTCHPCSDLTVVLNKDTVVKHSWTGLDLEIPMMFSCSIWWNVLGEEVQGCLGNLVAVQLLM